MRLEWFKSRLAVAVGDCTPEEEATVVAMEKGRAGERYLLGRPNWTFAEVRGPKLALPKRVLEVGASLLEHLYRARGNEPPMDRVTVEMAQVFWYCDSSKAKAEPGFSPRDPLETLDDTVRDLKKRFPDKAARTART